MKIVKPVILTTAKLLSSNVPENDYAAYSAGTTYALGARVIYVVGDTHWIVESKQNGNLNHTPTGLDTDVWWLKIGNTNRWKMFDKSVQSQTTNADSISFSVKLDQVTNAIVLLNVSCASVNVQVNDPIDGLVYNTTFNMVSDSGITDWYSYFSEPIVRKQDLAITDLPTSYDATITVTLTDTGNTAACGGCLFGLQRDYGGAQYGLSTGITDYSVKKRNDFGDYEVLERAYSKWADLSFYCDNSLIEQLQIELTALRATPTIYIGADDYGNTIVYGFYKDFKITIAYPTESIVTLFADALT